MLRGSEKKLRWYPQQPQRFILTNLSEACWEANFVEPDLALHQNPEPCWTWPGSAPKPPRPSPEPSSEPCWTWPGFAPKPPRPSPEPSPEPCWTWPPDLLRNLLRNPVEPDLALHQSLPDLLGNLLRNPVEPDLALHQSLPDLLRNLLRNPVERDLALQPPQLFPEPRWTWPGTCTSAHRSYSGLKTPLAYAVREKTNYALTDTMLSLQLCAFKTAVQKSKRRPDGPMWTVARYLAVALCVCWKLLSRFQSRSTAAVAQRNASLSMSMPESNTDLKACPVALWPDFLAYAGGGGVVSPQQIWIFCRCILRFDSFCIRFVSFLPLPASSCLLPPASTYSANHSESPLNRPGSTRLGQVAAPTPLRPGLEMFLFTGRWEELGRDGRVCQAYLSDSIWLYLSIDL